MAGDLVAPARRYKPIVAPCWRCGLARGSPQDTSALPTPPVWAQPAEQPGTPQSAMPRGFTLAITSASDTRMIAVARGVTLSGERIEFWDADSKLACELRPE